MHLLQEQRDAAIAQQARAEQGESEAQEQKARAEQELQRARRSLFNAQVWRAAGLWQREPQLARRLLEDTSVCPEDLRDFAWAHYHRLSGLERGRLTGHADQVTALAVTAD